MKGKDERPANLKNISSRKYVGSGNFLREKVLYVPQIIEVSPFPPPPK
jgi:hypothetical protein